MITAIQPHAALARVTARKLQIIEVEAWFEVLKDLAEKRGLYLELENRLWKSAYVHSKAEIEGSCHQTQPALKTIVLSGL